MKQDKPDHEHLADETVFLNACKAFFEKAMRMERGDLELEIRVSTVPVVNENFKYTDADGRPCRVFKVDEVLTLRTPALMAHNETVEQDEEPVPFTPPADDAKTEPSIAPTVVAAEEPKPG